ncbi:nickel-dependent hydrogenase large subunit [Piscinibacter defluvii]|uniref:nickel-dependent hydrogenase large subunit n=1 Tax=Piscinibacter defluvii TaxID=1796922 RepID=UPI000FDEEB30|nr:nickel-dependent hydrogenase large subunit [Piscinibacter defluvii]
MSQRLIVGPFNRVEGDLEVRLEVADGRVVQAHVNAPMYRGFEQMLAGRAPHDALVIVPRICGICSVSQSVAAARALADAAGLEVPPNGLHAVNLMLACENLADHLSHFYLFFMPDFTRAAYAARPWFGEAVRRFAALAGEHARAAIAARQRWFELMGTLGGKWPHTGSVVPGGSARAIEPAERLRLLARVRELRAFLENTTFAAPLEEIAALPDEAALQAWHAADPLRGDLRLFLTIAADVALHRLGRGPGRMLSYGAYPQPGGTHALAAGLWDAAAGVLEPLDLRTITEDSTHAWLAADVPRHPAQGHTEPQADKPGGYTWNKAPRLAGRVVETGAIARQLADGQGLLRDAVARHGASVYTRVLARLVETARVLPMMERWLAALQPREPFCAPERLPEDAEGSGLTEAARGALGHWLRVRHGRIAHYQIVAPTGWNFSPRDAAGTPGALEAALVGVPVPADEPTPVAVQHVVRSFDPCMVCTVH